MPKISPNLTLKTIYTEKHSLKIANIILVKRNENIESFQKDHLDLAKKENVHKSKDYKIM